MFLIAVFLFPHNLLLYLKGMHGTVEWLPGSPLGSTVDSWPGQRESKGERVKERECVRVREREQWRDRVIEREKERVRERYGEKRERKKEKER